MNKVCCADCYAEFGTVATYRFIFDTYIVVVQVAGAVVVAVNNVANANIFAALSSGDVETIFHSERSADYLKPIDFTLRINFIDWSIFFWFLPIFFWFPNLSGP